MSISNKESHRLAPPWRAVLPRLAVQLAGWWTALAVFVIVVDAFLQGQNEEVLLERAQGRLTVARQMIQKEMFEVVGDMRAAAVSPAVRTMVSEPTVAMRERLESSFSRIAMGMGRYRRVQLVGTDRSELLRVDASGDRIRAAPPDTLATLRDADWVGSDLKEGEISASSLRLVTEDGGRLVRPDMPMLSLAMPVMNTADGRRGGLVVFHYLAQGMLRSYREMLEARSGEQAMLLNSGGYWINNHERRDEWGFAHGRGDLVFQARFPAEWQAMNGQARGHVRTDAGLFAFERIYPFDIQRSGVPNANHARPQQLVGPHRDDAWIAVAFVPADVLAGMTWFRSRHGQLSVLAAALVMLLPAYRMVRFGVRERISRAADARATEEIRDLYENAPCGYQSLAPDGQVVRINQTALDWLGYTRDEVVGKLRLGDLVVGGADAPALVAMFEALRGPGHAREVSLDMVRKDGVVLQISLSASAVRDASGDLRLCRMSMFDVSSQRQLEQELARQARTDVLTGLYNRRFFLELGARELNRAKRSGSPLSLMLLDVDRFKLVNDTHGHQGGDQVLKALTSALQEALRNFDILARLGGEEFVVLMPDTGVAKAHWVAERVRMAVSQVRVPMSGGEMVSFTVSIGVTQCNSDRETIENMVKLADEAMYHAKTSGRNRVRVAAECVEALEA